MFARLVRFSVESGSDAKLRELADEIGPLIAVQPGCRAVTIFGGPGEGECGIYVLWDTQETANAAAAVVRPRLDEHLAAVAKAPPETKLFPVVWSN